MKHTKFTREFLNNVVWIELIKPDTDEEGDKRAKLLSNMLKRLGTVDDEACFWNPSKKRYCFSTGGGGFEEAADDGHWFNLDYCGRD